MDLAVRQHDPGLGDVLDGKFSPPALPRQSPNRSGQVYRSEALSLVQRHQDTGLSLLEIMVITERFCNVCVGSQYIADTSAYNT